MTYKEEQKVLFLNYLENHVFAAWKGKIESSYKSSLELIVSPACNTKCSYCYYKNYDKYIYPASIAHKDQILENCEKLLKWVQKENFKPSDVEIFSGEFLNLPYCETFLEMLSTYLPQDKTTFVSIPTNCTFCLTDKDLNRVQGYLDKYNGKSNIYIGLSLSCDGKPLDNETRALRNGKKYDDAYYDRLFRFAEKNKCGFHPMIGAKGIEKWKENIDWYVENIQKYFNVSELEAIKRIYLLEVRNPDWTAKEIQEFNDWIDYYTDKVFKACNNDPKTFLEEFINKRGSNLFSSCISIIGRGLGCSIQHAFGVRLGDLALVPCHRTAYTGYNAGYLKFDEQNNMDIVLENPDLWMFVNAFNSRTAPKCDNCPINHICNKFCLGCNYEVNKDFFIPVDTVCDMEIQKTMSLVWNLRKTGVLETVYRQLGQSEDAKAMIREMKALVALQDEILKNN